MLHLGIDASNIRQGGGVTHLSQLLNAADPAAAGIERITVWAARSMAAALPARPWLEVRSPAWLEAGMPRRMFGQQFQLAGELKQAGCDVLFSPGGTLPLWCSIPTVTMSQNMLPFEPLEALRFGRWSGMRLKMWLLRQSQIRSFKRADGLIFLTQYARDGVSRWLGKAKGRQVTISHGIEPRFAANPRQQKPAQDYSFHQPFTFLYVSILMPYKHQIQVAKAASDLRRAGSPVRVRFVGAESGRYGKQFSEMLRQIDPQGEFLLWPGCIPFEDLHAEYQVADAFLFASSCENLPNILIEAMTAGLPIACSNRGPMPEVLGDAGVYFDPLWPQEITAAMRKLIHAVDLRAHMAEQARELSRAYSWHRCAKETFEFIAAVAAQRKAFPKAQK